MTCESCERILNDNKRILKDNELLKKRLAALEKLLNIYDNPHTPPSQKRTVKKASGDDAPKGKPGRKEGHEGTTRPYREPDESVAATMNECPCCGNALGKPKGWERRLIEDIPEPQPARVTEYLLARYECPGCGKEVTAAHPDCPKDGRFGKNMIALSTLLRHKGRLTCRNAAGMLRIQHGVEVTPAAVLSMTQRAADALRPEYDEIRGRVAGSDAVNSDETSVRVGGINHWGWVFASGMNVLFRIHRSRGKAVLREMLGDFNGVLGMDGWRAYAGLPCMKQRCWAHILREADKLAETEKEAEGLAGALHILFWLMKSRLSKDPPPHERIAIHTESASWLGKWLSMDYRSEKVAKFVQKIRNGRDDWFTFILHPGVEPTNNAAERPLREFVVQRKIFGTLRSREGMYRYETIMSVFETWKRHDMDIFGELKKRL